MASSIWVPPGSRASPNRHSRPDQSRAQFLIVLPPRNQACTSEVDQELIVNYALGQSSRSISADFGGTTDVAAFHIIGSHGKKNG
jgi:hypothetical protein